MGDVRWTDGQLLAIEEKGQNILVAAGAGSGKTAVLVERIIQKIINDKMDIDKILVVTFTNAAAAEMRERILEAIYKKLEEVPNDEHLQKQIILLGRSNISTIHSFCLDVIKNNFYEINVSPNFRIGDEAEIALLKQETIEEIFEELYEKEDEEFIQLLDIYDGYRNDDKLKEIILKIYNYIQSSPFPMEWLDEKVEDFNISDDQDIAKTKWGEIIITEFKELVQDGIKKLENIISNARRFSEMEKWNTVMQADINEYTSVIAVENNWDNLCNKAYSIDNLKWPVDKKVELEIKDIAKQVRDDVKKNVFKARDTYLNYTSEEIKQDMQYMYKILTKIKTIIQQFSELFENKKREKNVIDFNNIEHFALEILVKRNEKGVYQPTEVAKKYIEKFEEIAIDEYQDSNMVQEYILSTISNGKNMFMVGDVKQSIYKFRQARPELFLGKYEAYKLKENLKANDDLKIQLFQNFRSRSNILQITNVIFENIMSKELGDINYNEEEYLRQDKDYEEPEDKKINYAGKAELHIIDMAKDEEDEEVEELHMEKAEIEANFVANKIQELLEKNYQIYDKKQKKYRKVEYKDMVILLRATSAIAPVYEKTLVEKNIPVFSDAGAEYLYSIEIQTIMSVLKIIDNPLQDIPLVAVMRSMIGGFSDNELIKIRLHNKKGYYYNALKQAQEKEEGLLKTKIEDFLEKVSKWREKSKHINIDELIWTIYLETGYYNYASVMPDGNVRVANLKMLFEKAKNFESSSVKGLFNFINFIDKIKLSSGDMGAAKLIGENENVVRIMSIHKSKGLEFPVVFLCDTAKQFNMRDLNENIMLHQDIGLGPKYIDPNKKISYNTMAKEAIKIQAKREAISEEMRVLYVALTRAREKLIITGVEKNYNKTEQNQKKALEIYTKLEPILIKQYKSYLNWIELVNLCDEKMKDLIEVHTHKVKDISKLVTPKEENTEDLIKKWLPTDNEVKKEIAKLLTWEYSNKFATTLESKTSVTKIKQLQMGEQQNQITLPKPKFLNKTEKLTNAEKGTLVHLCMQKLDFSKENDMADIEEMIKDLVVREIITENEAEQINKQTIYNFAQSNIAKEIAKSKKVFKEAPFYINIPAKEIYKTDTDEKILVQGIIDLYFENQDGNLILLDYKTDRVENVEELKQKYKVQLELYKKALEYATNKQIQTIYIYSTCLNKTIEIK